MCGRYVLALRPEDLSQNLNALGLHIDELILRRNENSETDESHDTSSHGDPEQPNSDLGAEVRQSYNIAPGSFEPVILAVNKDGQTRRQMRAMKWGLIPAWSKESPDYRSILRTMNCRDDSLFDNKGMWTSMKHRKRCVVVAQGFYEWLNKAGKKVPHYIKRKDDQLLTFAGLWDCVTYEKQPPLYSFTIITTNSNKTLEFLHDRMPVVLEKGGIDNWLNPNKQWDMELQGLLRPWSGELEVYPVSSEVSKAGRSSPSYIVPLNERRDTIKGLFGRQTEANKVKEESTDVKQEPAIKAEPEAVKVKLEETEPPASTKYDEHGTKRMFEPSPKTTLDDWGTAAEVKPETPQKKLKTTAPSKSPASRKKRISSPGDRNAKITSFFSNPK